MEERKLIKLGNSSFAIALPKGWVDKSGLKKGDKIFLENNSNGEIIVSSEFKKVGEKEKEININDKDIEQIKREFTSHYINGVSVFKFTGNPLSNRKREIKELIKDYIGFEVIKEDGTEIVVKDFFKFEELNLNNLIKRIDNNTKEMFKILLESVKAKKTYSNDAEEISKIDLDINKFYFLLSRIMLLGMDNPSLTNKLKTTSIELFNYWWLAFHLEHCGDSLKYIFEQTKRNKDRKLLEKKLLPIFIKVKEKYENSLNGFYKKDPAEAYKTMGDGKKVWKLCTNLAKNENGFLSSIGENLKKVDDASYQIIKMASYAPGETW